MSAPLYYCKGGCGFITATEDTWCVPCYVAEFPNGIKPDPDANQVYRPDPSVGAMNAPNFVNAPDGWERPYPGLSRRRACLHDTFCSRTQWCIECGETVIVAFPGHRDEPETEETDVDRIVAAIDRLTAEFQKLRQDLTTSITYSVPAPPPKCNPRNHKYVWLDDYQEQQCRDCGLIRPHWEYRRDACDRPLAKSDADSDG